MEVYESLYFYEFKKCSEHKYLTITLHPHPRKFLFKSQRFLGDVIYMSTRGNTTYYLYGVDFFVKMVLDLIRVNRYSLVCLVGSSKGASGALVLGKRLKDAVIRNRLKCKVQVTAFSPMIDLVVSEKTPPSCETLKALSEANYFYKYFFALGGGGRIDKIFNERENDFFVVYGEKSVIDAYHCELLRGKVELIKLEAIDTHGTAAFFPFDDVKNEQYYQKLYNSIVSQQENDNDMKFLDSQAVKMSFEEFKEYAFKVRELYFKKIFPTAVCDTNVKLYTNEDLLINLKQINANLKNQITSVAQDLKQSREVIDSHNFKKQALEIKNLEQEYIIKQLQIKQLQKQLEGVSKESTSQKAKDSESKQKLSDFKLCITAKDRIHNHLAYKLGSAMILNSKSLWGYIRMPYVLSFIRAQHKFEQEKYKQTIAKNPALKLPKLESYADYKEALKEKESFTYKLGEAFIAANSAGGGGIFAYLAFFKEVRRLKRELKKKKSAG
ncbi:hypothetical protein [Helicobacter rodentium]|uniref:hypothetical protein n=1 Tax=Helicobacter rodentium TaxID=59617 RepID=UPI0012EBF80E|nr:hypothetical protein [Helicobacter rodentium]